MTRQELKCLLSLLGWQYASAYQYKKDYPNDSFWTGTMDAIKHSIKHLAFSMEVHEKWRIVR